MPASLTEWERAEGARSAAEAAHFDASTLIADEQNLARYFAPKADSLQPLEYSFHLLGDVRNKTVLEYGCGDGLNTILLAQRGAGKIIALDISPELIEIARRRLRVNGVEANVVEFVVGSAHDMPLPDSSIDVVFGIAILHHLNLQLAAGEVSRVLVPGGRAIFEEPVRNSPLLKTVRRLIPYRASDVSPFERPLTDRELREFSTSFSSYRAKAFTLPTTSLANIVPQLRRYAAACHRRDAALLRRFPALSYYATMRVVEMIK